MPASTRTGASVCVNLECLEGYVYPNDGGGQSAPEERRCSWPSSTSEVVRARAGAQPACFGKPLWLVVGWCSA